MADVSAPGSAGSADDGDSIAALLAGLEALSRQRPDRVLRLRGRLPPGAGVDGDPASAAGDDGAGEPFELLIFRGFSSLTTHPTAFDPDRAALPEGSTILTAELLLGPLDPVAETILAGPLPVATFRQPPAWH